MKRFLTAISIIVAIIVAFAFAIVLSQSQVSAGPTDNVSGYAQSLVEGGGLISMNCTNTGTCGDVDYGVNIDPTTGIWTGEAWSAYHGWINFGNSNFDSGICGSQPITDINTGETSGWAYMEAPQGASMDEHGAVTGCISMSGSNYGVNVNVQAGAATGYAWSGYDIITDTTGDGTNDWTNNNIPNVGLGWIDFSSIEIESDPDATSVLVTNSPINICPDDALPDANIEYTNAVRCAVSGDAWVQSGIVFTSADPAVNETGTLSLEIPPHTGVAQLSGEIKCNPASSTTSVFSSLAVNYLSSSDAQCQDPDPNPDPVDPTQGVCEADPSSPECLEFCEANPGDPICTPICAPGIDCYCDLNPEDTNICTTECLQDPALPQCNPAPSGPIYIDTREQ